jgi:hypothetical protein
MNDERDLYGDNEPRTSERILVGYCGYSKDPIYEDDDYLEYRGVLYLRENFVQMNLDTDGNVVHEED